MILASSMVQNEPAVCWVCLEEASGKRHLYQPCSCPRSVHKQCLARWQLHSAGTKWVLTLGRKGLFVRYVSANDTALETCLTNSRFVSICITWYECIVRASNLLQKQILVTSSEQLITLGLMPFNQKALNLLIPTRCCTYALKKPLSLAVYILQPKCHVQGREVLPLLWGSASRLETSSRPSHRSKHSCPPNYECHVQWPGDS